MLWWSAKGCFGAILSLLPCMLLPALAGCANRGDPADSALRVERISTRVYFPRGLVIKDDKLYVLSRGRVRESGGVSTTIDDEAGTIFEIDPSIAQNAAEPVTEAVKQNGRPFAAPTQPPFRLLNRSMKSAVDDRLTDRPYCTLRYDPATECFYMCAFSGIDKAVKPPERNFSKNLTDAVFRFDLRTRKWYEVERHDAEAGGVYPHHDTGARPPPHGWLSGPDNCLVVGRWLYVAAKDNSRLARYDLSEIARNPDAPPPPSDIALGERVWISGSLLQTHLGHSMLAERDGWLYVGYRTSSTIVRYKLASDGTLSKPIIGQLVARFDPYDPATGKSANLTDMDFDSMGRLYVISAQPARVYRFTPSGWSVYDARKGNAKPWADLAELTRNDRMKCENVLVDRQDRVYVTSGDAYGHAEGYGGAVYRVTESPQ